MNTPPTTTTKNVMSRYGWLMRVFIILYKLTKMYNKDGFLLTFKFLIE